MIILWVRIHTTQEEYVNDKKKIRILANEKKKINT